WVPGGGQGRRGVGCSAGAAGVGRGGAGLVGLQQALSLGPMLLLSMSQGSRVALHFARDHPGRLLGLILDGAALDGFEPQARGSETIPLDHYAALVREGRIDGFLAAWRAHPLMQGGSAPFRAELDRILDDYEARDLIAGGPHELEPLAGVLETIA